jgi:tRNA pseudouridine38-40 synthase
MYNYKLIIEYDGTGYLGWQRQKQSKNTIQETLERSLKQITGSDITLTGAGRTDTGVHAFNQAANFKLNEKLEEKKFLYSLNSVLPEAITVKEITEVPPEFNARHSAKKREYEYYITTAKKSIYNDYFTYIKYKLDTAKIEDSLKLFTGEKSFRSLCKNKTDKHNFRCEVYRLELHKLNVNEYKFTICASRFLHSMVRAVIGCLIDIGRGKISQEEVKTRLKKGEKIRAAFLPAKGLFLKKIYY